MVILMNSDCRKADIGRVFSLLGDRSLTGRLIAQEPKTVIGVVEEVDPDLLGRLTERISGLNGVESVETFGTSYKLASRAFRDGTTAVRTGDKVIGDGGLALIAGPCAVESRNQIIRIARAVARAGGSFLRGGAFKPRTSPYSFRGLGEEGLKYLAEASRMTGLPVVTEVLTVEEVSLVAGYADILQIGTRNMQNPALLEAVGEVDRPVLLKRGMMASLKEFLLSAEYILARGNPRVILCERGIRTFSTETRNTLDISAVPLLKRLSHLPVVVDPSHAAGKRELVPALALAAAAAGADGLMIEIHPDPDRAASDGRQSLDLETFAGLAGDLERLAAAVPRPVSDGPNRPGARVRPVRNAKSRDR